MINKTVNFFYGSFKIEKRRLEAYSVMSKERSFNPSKFSINTKFIDLRHTDCKSLSFLKGLPHVSYVNAEGTQISNLSHVYLAGNLAHIKLSNTPFSQNKYYRIMLLIALSDKIQLIDNVRVKEDEINLAKKIGAAVHPYLYDGWILKSIEPVTLTLKSRSFTIKDEKINKAVSKSSFEQRSRMINEMLQELNNDLFKTAKGMHRQTKPIPIEDVIKSKKAINSRELLKETIKAHKIPNIPSEKQKKQNILSSPFGKAFTKHLDSPVDYIDKTLDGERVSSPSKQDNEKQRNEKHDTKNETSSSFHKDIMNESINKVNNEGAPISLLFEYAKTFTQTDGKKLNPTLLSDLESIDLEEEEEKTEIAKANSVHSSSSQSTVVDTVQNIDIHNDYLENQTKEDLLFASDSGELSADEDEKIIIQEKFDQNEILNDFLHLSESLLLSESSPVNIDYLDKIPPEEEGEENPTQFPEKPEKSEQSHSNMKTDTNKPDQNSFIVSSTETSGISSHLSDKFEKNKQNESQSQDLQSSIMTEGEPLSPAPKSEAQDINVNISFLLPNDDETYQENILNDYINSKLPNMLLSSDSKSMTKANDQNKAESLNSLETGDSELAINLDVESTTISEPYGLTEEEDQNNQEEEEIKQVEEKQEEEQLNENIQRAVNIEKDESVGENKEEDKNNNVFEEEQSFEDDFKKEQKNENQEKPKTPKKAKRKVKIIKKIYKKKLVKKKISKKPKDPDNNNEDLHDETIKQVPEEETNNEDLHEETNKHDHNSNEENKQLHEVVDIKSFKTSTITNEEEDIDEENVTGQDILNASDSFSGELSSLIRPDDENNDSHLSSKLLDESPITNLLSGSSIVSN